MLKPPRATGSGFGRTLASNTGNFDSVYAFKPDDTLFDHAVQVPMLNRRNWIPALALTVAGAALPAAGTTPLVVVVHKSSAFETISAAELRRMLTGELRAWPDKRPVVLIQQPETRDVQRRMLKGLLGTTPEGYRQMLLAVQFQGNELPFIKVLNSDDMAIKFVWNVPGAVAVVSADAAAAASEHVRILRVDGKAPGDSGYLLR